MRPASIFQAIQSRLGHHSLNLVLNDLKVLAVIFADDGGDERFGSNRFQGQKGRCDAGGTQKVASGLVG